MDKTIIKKDSKKQDKYKRKYDGKLFDKDTPFAITEAFKMLRTNLIYSVNANNCPVFAVTSAFSNVGKSVVISNAALSYAQLDKKVLLIDGDMRRPSINTIFGIKSNEGLSEILLGVNKEKTYSDYYNETSCENLTVISSGHIPLNPSELLASSYFDEFITKMKSEFDCIFIDLPPICTVIDAGSIVKHVTGYLIVVRANYSDYHSVDSSIEALKQTKGNILGFVINDLNPKSSKKQRDYYKY